MVESKQVKVDNWGIFFLQRLQQFFNKTFFCDLTLQFENNVQLKVHRLVLNACTEYFRLLEQTCDVVNNCLIMPSELQPDVIVPIVNFMYTGILEFHEPIFNRLYATAQLLNMTVLTKLLDAQKTPIAPIPRQTNRRIPSHVTWNLQGKKISPRTMDPDLPEPLPGRKLPVWRRRAVPTPYRTSDLQTVADPLAVKYIKREVDDTPKPTRFEWPEEEEGSFETSSFDEISYTSRPISVPPRDKSPRPSTSNFEELKRSSVKRPLPSGAATNPQPSKRVNIQDVKEYLREQKLRSDYIEYDEAEAADNDLQTYNDDDSGDDAPEKITAPTGETIVSDETPSKSILKSDSSSSHNKRVRFSLEEKENSDTKVPVETALVPSKPEQTVDMSNHTKIITEVLRKYPHLVKKNKNIRLKILAKGSTISSIPNIAKIPNVTTTTTSPPKPTSKVSYMVMKPDVRSSSNDNKKDGHWTCRKCPDVHPPQFDSYYLFRKHLTEAHQEKVDSQMCNVCGHTSRKQNMLVYHRFIKHGVEPPAMYNFPKCSECDYIALSNTLLLKHQNNQSHGPLACAQCGTAFINKAAMLQHTELTGHVTKPDPDAPTADCSYCTAKFVSDEALFTHLRSSHREDAHKDGLISTEEALEKKPEVEEIVQPTQPPPSEKVKDNKKIKIISDVKITKPTASELLRPPAVRKPSEQSVENEVKVEMQTQEQSSEAESLSNVASGIAASLGLVNTIVVLDENQFILQSQDGSQERNTPGSQPEYILPSISSIENMSNLHVSQHQVITTSESNTIISQATLGKTNIASTDELVMVLTDHDYSDASNNTVLASNSSNIVVLYSHPVQGQDGAQYMSQPANIMLNTDMGLMEVDEQYTVTNGAAIPHKQCEESIEMIQQEINNQLEPDPAQLHAHAVSLEEEVVPFNDKITIVNEPSEFVPTEALPTQIEPIEEHQSHVVSELQLPQEEPQQVELVEDVPETQQQPSSNFEEPMDTGESIELIEKEINNTATTSENDVEPIVAAFDENVLREENEEQQQNIEEEGTCNVQNTETSQIIEDEAQMEREGQKLQNHEKEHQETEAPPIELCCKEPENDVLAENVNAIENNSTETETIVIPHTPETTEENTTNCQGESEHNESQHSEFEHSESEPTSTTVQNTEPDVSCIPEQPDQLQNESTEDDLTNIAELKEDLIPNEPDLSVGEQVLDINQELTSNETNLDEELTCVETNLQNTDKECETITTEEDESTEPVKETEEQQTQEEQLDIATKEADEEEEQEIITANVENDKTENDLVSEVIETTVSNVVEEEQVEKTPTVETVVQENNCEKVSPLSNPKISKLLDDWDDGDTDSQQSQSEVPKPSPVASSSINTLIHDWDDEEET